MDSRWHRLRDLFEQALLLPQPERPSFLDARCGDDPQLRQEVEALLAAGEQADSALSRTFIRPQSGEPSFEQAEHAYLGRLLQDRYRIQRSLGDGGFGSVYLAQDGQLDDRPVVIKFLPGAMARQSWHEQRYQQELQALARMDHPGIVSIYDSGETPDGVPYLVMQYVPGETLRHAARDKPMEITRIRRFLRQIGDALDTAHRTGISHRDLKPENIQVRDPHTAAERAVLLDFGLARLQDREGRSLQIAGTPAYMAPEQILGNAGPASDQYALGALVFELLTGRPLYTMFESGSASEAVKEALRTRTDLSRQARQSLERAVAFAPVERYPSVADFVQAFLDATQPEPPRNRKWLAAVGLTLIAVLAAIGIFASLPPSVTVAYSIAGIDGRTIPPETVFHSGDRIRLQFSSSHAGFLYLFNTSGDETAAPHLLFPGPPPKDGRVEANQIVQLPSSPQAWIEFDDNSGEEELWMIWSQQPDAELESYRPFGTPEFGGEVRDRATAGRLRQYLSQQSGRSILSRSGGVLRGRSRILIGKVMLRHE